MSVDESVRTRIRSSPDRPGIYIFQDGKGRALYVGKAKSIRKRTANYLGRDHEPRLARMLFEARQIEFVLTDTESEALLLENNWIKREQPRYNVLLRDDKSYPYVKLTLRHEYPMVSFTRSVRRDGAEYYGPFLPAGLARGAIKLVQKLFQIRVCRIPIDGTLPRPCLYYDMKRCLAPCVDGLTTLDAYTAAVEDARQFLSGKTKPLLTRLRREMEAAADLLEFERAVQLRETIFEIERVTQRRKLSSVRGDDVDIFGVLAEEGNAAVTLLVMRNGQVLDRREFFFETEEAVSTTRILSELLPQLYERTTFVPTEIHLPEEIEGADVLAEWLGERRGRKVNIRVPERGPKAERVRLATQNAKLAFQRRFRTGAKPLGPPALQKALDLESPPERIEGFDISNFQGSQTVASLVVWRGSAMDKKEYRSFNIRGLDGQDDFRAMRQAVERRYRRRLDEGGELPDLILIDGGRGQLNAALSALSDLGIEELPIVSLAKREEEIYAPHLPEPLRLSRRNPGLKLLQQVRDESHRFAVSRHRRRRRGATLHSVLDDLQGRRAEAEEDALAPFRRCRKPSQSHSGPDSGSGGAGARSGRLRAASGALGRSL